MDEDRYLTKTVDDDSEFEIESIDLIIDPTDPLRRHMIKHGVGRIRSGTRMLDNQNEWYTQWDDEPLPTPLMDVWLVRMTETDQQYDHVVGIYTTQIAADLAAQRAYREWECGRWSFRSIAVDKYRINRYMAEKDQDWVLV
ncbi:unnamed protein product [marine sediment metagenome]|uniref:Uncharacterized protein n=1 Tax=marine sediment metagenome TaxID=412755 RepID=X0SSN9_9ZZZZ